MNSERDERLTIFQRLEVWTQDNPNMTALFMASLSLLGIAGAVSAEQADNYALASGLAGFAGSTVVGTVIAIKNCRQ